MRTHCEQFCLLIGTGLWLCSAMADAAPQAAELARLKDSGVRQARAGNFAEAALTFEQVYQVERDAGNLWNWAYALEKSDQLRSALLRHQELVQEYPDHPRAKEAAQHILDIERRIHARVVVRCEPAKVVLTLRGPSGQQQGICPWEWEKLDPGRYELVANLTGHEPQQFRLELKAGQIEERNLQLVPLAGTTEGEGEGEGAGPGEGEGAPAGKRSPWFGIALATGGTGLVVGITGLALGLLGEGQADDAEEPTDLESGNQLVRVGNMLQIGGLAATGVAGAAALWFWLKQDADAPPADRPQVQLLPTPGGFVLQGNF